MCGFYCVAFIGYLLSGKALLDYTKLFSLSNYKTNDKMIYITILMINVAGNSQI